jgi:uncharacterized protein YllA (UPF0747 family)
VGLGLILSVGGILYNSYENSRINEKIVQRQTLDTAKQLLIVQDRLERNGAIVSKILEQIIENQEILINRTREIVDTQTDAMVQQISNYLKESRTLYLEQFEELRKDFKTNRELHKQTQRFLGIKNDSPE